MNLLVGMALYMMLPFLNEIFFGCGADGILYFGLACIVGMLLPGPFCNYWFDAYKRKSVCRRALWLMLLSLSLLFWLTPPLLRPLCGLAVGMAAGLFQMALGSTLLIDLSPADGRTLTAHVYYWFTRLALVLGPVASILLVKYIGFFWLPLLSALCMGVALLLLQTVEVPFRTPLEPSVVSLDRFWMPRAFRLFLGLLLAMLPVGLAVSLFRVPEYFALMAVGFFCSLSFHRLLWVGRDARREVLFGMALMIVAACLLFPGVSGSAMSLCLVAFLLSWGLGHVASRYLLLFVNVSEHCERGTAHTTYWLAWEGGLVSGLSMGYVLFSSAPSWLPVAALSALVLSLGVFLTCIYAWLPKACRR